MKFVYAILAPRIKEVKIGVSLDPYARLRLLQTAHSVELELLGTMPGGLEKEREIHRKLSDARITGEWFRFTPKVRALVRAEMAPHVIEPPPRQRRFSHRQPRDFVISYRIDDEEAAFLKRVSLPHESLSQCARRLTLSLL